MKNSRIKIIAPGEVFSGKGAVSKMCLKGIQIPMS